MGISHWVHAASAAIRSVEATGVAPLPPPPEALPPPPPPPPLPQTASAEDVVVFMVAVVILLFVVSVGLYATTRTVRAVGGAVRSFVWIALVHLTLHMLGAYTRNTWVWQSGMAVAAYLTNVARLWGELKGAAAAAAAGA